VLIPQTNGFAQRTRNTFTRALYRGSRTLLISFSAGRVGGIGLVIGRTGTASGIRAIIECTEPRLKSLLDNFGISRCEAVFGRQVAMRPGGRPVLRGYSRD